MNVCMVLFDLISGVQTAAFFMELANLIRGAISI